MSVKISNKCLVEDEKYKWDNRNRKYDVRKKNRKVDNSYGRVLSGKRAVSGMKVIVQIADKKQGRKKRCGQHTVAMCLVTMASDIKVSCRQEKGGGQIQTGINSRQCRRIHTTLLTIFGCHAEVGKSSLPGYFRNTLEYARGDQSAQSVCCVNSGTRQLEA